MRVPGPSKNEHAVPDFYSRPAKKPYKYGTLSRSSTVSISTEFFLFAGTKILAFMSHDISLQTAIDMTTRYRNNRAAILNPDQPSPDILPFCETFDRAAIDKLLEQTGCEKFRIYYGMDSELNIHAILVAVNDAGEDILPSGTSTAVILEVGQRCPHICPPSSPLNDQ